MRRKLAESAFFVVLFSAADHNFFCPLVTMSFIKLISHVVITCRLKFNSTKYIGKGSNSMPDSYCP